MNDKRINAGIKDKNEAMRRLEDGEVFYYNGSTLSYEAQECFHGRSPYRDSRDDERLATPIITPWGDIAGWEREAVWYENLRDKRLCFAVTSMGARGIVYIVGHDASGFTCENGSLWRYATPVKAEDLTKND